MIYDTFSIIVYQGIDVGKVSYKETQSTIIDELQDRKTIFA